MTLAAQLQSPRKARPITRAPFLFPSVLKPLKRDLHPDQQPDPDDSALVSSALAGLGHGSANLFSTIKDFQASQGLKTDGWMRPGGPTYQALNAAVAGGLGGAVPAGGDRDSWLAEHLLPTD